MKRAALLIATVCTIGLSGCLSSGTIPHGSSTKLEKQCDERGVQQLFDADGAIDVWVVCKDGSVHVVRIY